MSDILSGAVWGSVTALLFFVCWRLAASVLPGDDLYQKALHALLLCWALIVAAAAAMGSFNHLTAPLLLLAVALASLGVLAATRRLRRTISFQGMPAPRGDGQGSEAAKIAESALWLFLLSMWSYHVVRNGLLEFPDDFDTLMYHLPLIDHWLQAHSLYAPDAWQWSTPGNNELLGLWCAAPFSGDFLTPLMNLPAVLILALASREIALLLGSGRLPASVCAAAVVANYVVLNQLTDAENDIAVAALTLASAAYALRFARGGHGANLVLCGLSIGLLAGVKYYALGYAALVWLGLVGAVTASRGFRVGAKAGAVSAGLALCWGGYWYFRNWFLTGAPLFPKRFFAVNDEMAQYYPGLSKTTFVGNGSPELFSMTLKAIWKMTGPLHLAAFCCLPAVVCWLVISGAIQWRTPSRRSLGITRIFIGFLIVGAGVVLVYTPFAVEDLPGTLNQLKWAYCPVRYGMTFLSLAVVAFAALLTSASGWPRLGVLRAAPGLALLALSAYQIIQCVAKFKGDPADWGLLTLDGTLLGTIAIWFRAPVWKHPRFGASIVVAAGIVGAAAAAGSLSEQWHAGFAAFYDRKFEQGVFTALADPSRPAEIICVLDFRPYPFFGSRRQHHVCQPQKPSSPTDFYDYLRNHNVTLVAARFDSNLRSRGWELCESYIAQNPDLFTPAKETTRPYILFRVRQPQASTDAVQK